MTRQEKGKSQLKITRKPYAEQQLTLATHASGTPYLHFPAFDENGKVRHAFSTRMGGVSEGFFSSMNLSFTRGDDEQAVMENYRRFAAILDAKPEDVICTFQTHTTNIRMVTKEDAGKGVIRERDYTDIDGLITDDPSVVLTVFYADCVPLLFADPKKKVIGTAHAGWRGAVGGIGRKMTELLHSAYGCDPSDLFVAIGPSICGDCYEVGEDVIEQIREQTPAHLIDRVFTRIKEPDAYADRVVFQIPGAPKDKYRLDLWNLNRLFLTDAGVPQDHIYTTDICTKCNPDLLFSYRVHGEKRGNMAAFLRIGKDA